PRMGRKQNVIDGREHVSEPGCRVYDTTPARPRHTVQKSFCEYLWKCGRQVMLRPRADATGGLGLGAGQQRENAANQLLVVLDVVLEDPQLLQLDQVDGAEGLTGLHGPERDGLEA